MNTDRQTEHRVLAGPLGRSIAETRDADPARQSPLDGSLHELGGEERERDRQIDLSNAAFVPRSDLLDAGDGARCQACAIALKLARASSVETVRASTQALSREASILL